MGLGFMRAVALIGALLVSACGGGGSSSAVSASPAGGFSAQFSPPSVVAGELEGFVPAGIRVDAELKFAVTADQFIFVSHDDTIVLGVSGQLNGSGLSATVSLRGDLPPGVYTTEVRVHSCLDDPCTREVAGSPARLPVRFVVQPNLQLQPRLVLARSGAEAAPTASLPVTIPAAAGVVTLQTLIGSPDAFGVSFDGSQLHVQTRQVAAGAYTATATLQSQTDPRYSRSVDILYTVTAPAGGQKALSIDDPLRNIYLLQGGQSLQQLQVTRPTWTNAWDAPLLIDDQHMLTLVDLGNDRYEVTVRAAGVPVGNYAPAVCFSAGPTGGQQCASFAVNVGAPFYLDNSPVHSIEADSTAASLLWTHAVVSVDGATDRWTAVSQSPLLRVLNGSGRAGIDSLQVAFDPAALALPDFGFSLPVQVSTDRAGTAPQTFYLSVNNSIPTLQRRSPAVLVGSAGRVFIEGAGIDRVGNTAPAWLQVTGATLGRVQVLSDTRFAGSVSVLALDLTGAVPGQTVTVRINSPLRPTQVQVQVQAPLRAGAAFQQLPFGSYRPAQFAPGLDALYFSGRDVAYRWRRSGAAWTLGQASQPGLIDVALGADEQSLFAIDGGQVVALDPLTFTRQSAGAFQDSFQRASGFDGSAMPALRAFAFAADGRSMASMLNDLSGTTTRGVGLVCSWAEGNVLPPLTQAPTACDPGQRLRDSGGATGSGLVRSVNGSAVVAVDQDGVVSVYDVMLRQWASGGFSALRLAGGQTIAAVSDAGTRLVRSDGMLSDPFGLTFGSLAAVVPATHLPGGYGMTSDGRFGLVYGYRVTGTGSTQRAVDATLWVVDLRNVTAPSGVTTAPLLAAVALPGAVGCNSAPVAGETCQHAASVSVAPGDGTAFVLGPRGVLSAPLPAATVSAAQAPGQARQRVLQRLVGATGVGS